MKFRIHFFPLPFLFDWGFASHFVLEWNSSTIYLLCVPLNDEKTWKTKKKWFLTAVQAYKQRRRKNLKRKINFTFKRTFTLQQEINYAFRNKFSFNNHFTICTRFAILFHIISLLNKFKDIQVKLHNHPIIFAL